MAQSLPKARRIVLGVDSGQRRWSQGEERHAGQDDELIHPGRDLRMGIHERDLPQHGPQGSCAAALTLFRQRISTTPVLVGTSTAWPPTTVGVAKRLHRPPKESERTIRPVLRASS
jgi:hypothetical protein